MASNSIEEAVSVVLKASSTITNYIGTGANARLYEIDAPANTTTLPYITYQTISRPNVPHLLGQKMSQARVQVSVWHNHKRNGKDLAQNVVELFDQRTGAIDSYGTMLTETTGPIQIKDPDHDNLYQFVVDLIIDYAR